ncbi:MAG: type II toxin-antitoxin system HicA family toxin [Chloroflexi bacterium]|nr:type II toxin-antitoxin system HicA family toxin [Chloroflexota bacterium]
MNRRRLLRRLLRGALNNVAFGDMMNLMEGFGFTCSRVSASHHIFVHSDIPEMLNLQSVGGEAKPYQIRQVLKVVERYNLQLEDGNP